MAPASNWLSFSLSPMEILATHHTDDPPQILPSPHHHYSTFFDTFYTNDWENPKSQGVMYTADCSAAGPKLDGFLGGDNNTTSFNNSQDESSSQLTHLYGATNYFSRDDLKAMPENGFLSTANSGSEVDDSASVGRATQLSCAASEFVAQSIETGFAAAANGGSLSLGVVCRSSEKGLDSDSAKKISDTFGQRTSIYRGVTRHRWTGRYEAHLWDNSCRREGQARKGRQVYLGGYDKEDKAARAYDLAALKYWGPTVTTNFPISNYAQELEEMKNATKQEFIASLRRKSSGFSRGASIYRGVTRHHQQGRWQARIGRVAGNKDLYLGTFATEEEAAEAYDIAAIKFRGLNAVTNFEMNRYNVDAILNSNLPVGGAAKRLKLATEASNNHRKPTLSRGDSQSHHSSNTIDFAAAAAAPISCNVPFDTAAATFHHNLIHQLGSNGSAGAQAVGSESTFPMARNVGPQTPPGFYLWPHQSY